jgi:hypothetical protein
VKKVDFLVVRYDRSVEINRILNVIFSLFLINAPLSSSFYVITFRSKLSYGFISIFGLDLCDVMCEFIYFLAISG